MAKFEQFDIDDETNHFKPICNKQCCAYSILISIGCFLIPILILSIQSYKIDYNYEFQLKPFIDNSTNFIKNFEDRLYSVVKIDNIEKLNYKQYSWKPIEKNNKIEDVILKYRVWVDKNDFTLKLKDLFKENVNKVKIKINKRYKNIKKKVELNMHWIKNDKVYTTYSWQQSAKIRNIEFPKIVNTEDILHYFPNADDIFNNCNWINYNIKDVTVYRYTGKINSEKIEFDLMLENDKIISFEYKWYKLLTLETTKIVKKIVERLI